MHDELRSNAAALAFLKLMQNHWDHTIASFNDPHNAVVTRLVIIGWMERKPVNFTSLAAGLGVSRQQAARRCESMRQAGWITYQRTATPTSVRPTEQLIRLYEVHVEKRMPAIWDRWKRIAALMGAVTVETIVAQLDLLKSRGMHRGTANAVGTH